MQFSNVFLLCATVLVAVVCSTEARPDYGMIACFFLKLQPNFSPISGHYAGQPCHREGEMFAKHEFKHEDCEDEYYKCVNGHKWKFECSMGRVFDREDKECTLKFKCIFD
jgi:hypothetical protein